MVDTNKILTVSYGTFSCTLEGFDDSFGTMKAIAEYFRDLAADDRYFGAEPPTPDAEMLARIAEKEISRRVEAHLDKNNIVLRADRDSILPLAMREEARDTEFDPSAAAETAPVKPAEAELEAYKAEAMIEDVSEATLTKPVGIADQMAPVAEAVAEDIAEDEADAPIATQEDQEQAEAEEIARQDVAEEIAAAPEPAYIEPVIEDTAPDAEPEDDSNSVAAKLRRIRAVVSQGSSVGADPLYSEDEHADDFLAETHRELEAAITSDDAAEAAEADDNAPTATSDEDISALLDRFGGAEETEEDEEDDSLFFPEAIEDDDAAAEVAIAPEEEADAEIEALEDEDEPVSRAVEEAAPIHARIIKMKRADFEAAVAAGGIEEEEAGEETSLSAEEEEELLRELAAVEAELQHADIDADEDAYDDEDDAVAAEFQDDFEDEAEEEDFAHFEDDVEDQDEDEDDFARFDGDLDEEDGEDEDDNIFGADESDAEDSEHRQTPFAADAESEMGRIFAETDTQMDEETGKGRRNAIAHLRAAVAAAKAEEGAGGKLTGPGPDTEAYRDDLANVVRPRRPEAGKAQTRRPEAPRPAPLKLVAEQRVDIDEAKPVQPVRPRRVAMSPAALPDDAATDGDFAEYAESVGAGSLPELLEAAAAYLSFVEGREQFSRPQLMTHVRQVEKDDFSREDGLRSFGQLLREGKIEKLEGGRFKASESISYRPDARYAGE